MNAGATRAIPERADVWRIDGIRADDSGPFKEWQHFAMFADGIDLLINFSIDQPDLGTRTGRVIVLARTDGWHGGLETVGASVSNDARIARFGPAEIEIRDGTYRVLVDWPHRGIALSLTMRPLTAPIYATHRPGAEKRLHWALIARLAVNGSATIGRSSFAFANAGAYHDHNWGSFSWGNDFAWEWGAILPDSASCPWSCVLSRVSNRARTVVRSQHLFLWRNARNVLAAEGDDVVKHVRGSYRSTAPPFRVPPEMTLVDSRCDVDLPEELVVRGTAGDDVATIRFRCDSTARIIVPSERDPLGKIVIHECVGGATVHGSIAREPLDWGGRGVFEFLRG